MGVAERPDREMKRGESRGSVEGSVPPGSWPPVSRLRGCPPRYCLVVEGEAKGEGGSVRWGGGGISESTTVNKRGEGGGRDRGREGG